ncbi:hypothetical protein BHM03_00062804, partial [Ensete ventricosum]
MRGAEGEDRTTEMQGPKAQERKTKNESDPSPPPRVERNGGTNKSTDARALTTERRFQPESKILITIDVGEFTYSTET